MKTRVLGSKRRGELLPIHGKIPTRVHRLGDYAYDTICGKGSIPKIEETKRNVKGEKGLKCESVSSGHGSFRWYIS